MDNNEALFDGLTPGEPGHTQAAPAAPIESAAPAEPAAPAEAEAPRAAAGADRVFSGETGGVSGAYRFGPGSFVTTRGSARTYSYSRPNPEPSVPNPVPSRPDEPFRAADPYRSAGAFSPGETVRPAGPPRGAAPWGEAAWGTAANPAGMYGTAPRAGAPAAYEPIRRERARPSSEGRVIPRSRWWIPLALIGALALGLLLGVFGLRTLRGSDSSAAPTAPPASGPSASAATVERDTAPISDRIEHGDPGMDYTTPAQIYQQNVNCVVGVSNESTTTNIWGQVTPVAITGTGFILSEDGYILTNYHVARDADKLTVSLYDGRKFPATLVGYESTTCDVALLKIDADGLTPVRIGDSDALQVGEPVCAIGNPLGELTYTLTVGYISAKERAVNSDGNPISMLQTDAAINNGNSGGPLFDFSGNVIGIVTAKASGSSSSGATVEGLGFAIPINAVMNMIDDLKVYGRANNRAYLGVTVGDASQRTDENLPNGAYISSVEAGHCAEQAGIRAGDVVIGLDERTILSYADLLAAIQAHTAGQRVVLRVWRDGETLELPVTFDARPEDGN